MGEEGEVGEGEGGCVEVVEEFEDAVDAAIEEEGGAEDAAGGVAEVLGDGGVEAVVFGGVIDDEGDAFAHAEACEARVGGHGHAEDFGSVGAVGGDEVDDLALEVGEEGGTRLAGDEFGGEREHGGGGLFEGAVALVEPLDLVEDAFEDGLGGGGGEDGELCVAAGGFFFCGDDLGRARRWCNCGEIRVASAGAGEELFALGGGHLEGVEGVYFVVLRGFWGRCRGGGRVAVEGGDGEGAEGFGVGDADGVVGLEVAEEAALEGFTGLGEGGAQGAEPVGGGDGDGGVEGVVGLGGDHDLEAAHPFTSLLFWKNASSDRVRGLLNGSIFWGVEAQCRAGSEVIWGRRDSLWASQRAATEAGALHAVRASRRSCCRRSNWPPMMRCGLCARRIPRPL